MIRNNFIVLIVIVSLSCNTKYDKLAKYYKDNTRLHHEIADSLMTFSRIHKTNVTLMVMPDGKKTIAFRIYFENINSQVPILFDSLLNRNDPYPDRTSHIYVPGGLIKNFKNSIYPAIKADSNQVFFGYRNYYGSNDQYGILIDYDEYRIKDNIKRLSPNACIYKGIIP